MVSTRMHRERLSCRANRYKLAFKLISITLLVAGGATRSRALPTRASGALTTAWR